MSPRVTSEAFAARLRGIIDDFRLREKLLRDEYTRGPETTRVPKELTERVTRRFLIDELLRALDWDPGDPERSVEEARTLHPSGDWLFLDYLGVDPGSRKPAVIFEAKSFDVEPPRPPRARRPTSRDMPVIIAAAIDALRQGGTATGLLAEWAEYLGDMHRYLQSMDSQGKASLQRVVISSGRWMIIFEAPCRTFLGDKSAEPELIHCFVDFEDLLAGSDDILELLHRERLVDTLPFVLDIADALSHIPADRIEQSFRGALVVTSESSGARRARYPTRAIYPALVVHSGSRWFAITDLHGRKPVEEPRSVDRLGAFLEELDRAGMQLERRVAALFGSTIDPSPLGAFPGFPGTRRTSNPLRGPFEPTPGSAAQMAPVAPAVRAFTTVSDAAAHEFVVAVGIHRFYKADVPRGAECSFHYWKAARDAIAEKGPHQGFTNGSYTEDGQDRHCAHAGMLAMRADRCRIRQIETHVCCRACVFESECWSEPDDRARMPCPALTDVFSDQMTLSREGAVSQLFERSAEHPAD